MVLVDGHVVLSRRRLLRGRALRVPRGGEETGALEGDGGWMVVRGVQVWR
jgi:hypothetical protein